MRRNKVFTFGVAAIGFFGSSVAVLNAADLLGPPPMAEPVAYPVTELGSGWYLRGDFTATEFGKVREEPFGQGVPFDRLSLKETWGGGGGVGYKFNNWVRADITADWRADADFRAYSSRTNYTEGFSTDRAKVEVGTLLVNGYVDLGTWWGVTPYVGAGVGAAQNFFHRYTGQVTCLTVVCGSGQDPADPAFVPAALGAQNPPASVPSRTSYNLAWALMGGVAVDLPAGFKLDVGYRYANVGEARTRLDSFGVGTRLQPLDLHEVRAGIRYMID